MADNLSLNARVLVAGIAGFREQYIPRRNPSAGLLDKWGERGGFVWLVTEDILEQYKEVLKRLGVRPHLIGRVVNLIRERAENDADFIVTLNTKDFPQGRLRAKVKKPEWFFE